MFDLIFFIPPTGQPEGVESAAEALEPEQKQGDAFEVARQADEYIKGLVAEAGDEVTKPEALYKEVMAHFGEIPSRLSNFLVDVIHKRAELIRVQGAWMDNKYILDLSDGNAVAIPVTTDEELALHLAGINAYSLNALFMEAGEKANMLVVFQDVNSGLEIEYKPYKGDENGIKIYMNDYIQDMVDTAKSLITSIDLQNFKDDMELMSDIFNLFGNKKRFQYLAASFLSSPMTPALLESEEGKTLAGYGLTLLALYLSATPVLQTQNLRAEYVR